MNTRPILFSGEMVRAILDGRKTQTRRVMKSWQWPRENDDAEVVGQYPDLRWLAINNLHRRWGLSYNAPTLEKLITEYLPSACPFGRRGDRLWVRENWGVVSHQLGPNEELLPWIPDRPARAVRELKFGKGYYDGHVIFEADGPFTWGDPNTGNGRSCWHPSIHMPRAISRITLEITSVRVERLQDISNSDIKAEGITQNSPGPDYGDGYPPRLREQFQHLWESVNGKESWGVNPWVWGIEFRRVQ